MGIVWPSLERRNNKHESFFGSTLLQTQHSQQMLRIEMAGVGRLNLARERFSLRQAPFFMQSHGLFSQFRQRSNHPSLIRFQSSTEARYTLGPLRTSIVALRRSLPRFSWAKIARAIRGPARGRGTA